MGALEHIHTHHASNAVLLLLLLRKYERVFAVKNATWQVVKIRPEKISGLYGIWTHDLCDTGAVPTSWVYLEPTWWPAPSWLVSSVGRALHRYRRGHGFKLYKPEFLSGLIFTTAQVVFITAKISLIFTPFSGVQIYDSHIFTVDYYILLLLLLFLLSQSSSLLSISSFSLLLSLLSSSSVEL